MNSSTLLKAHNLCTLGINLWISPEHEAGYSPNNLNLYLPRPLLSPRLLHHLIRISMLLLTSLPLYPAPPQPQLQLQRTRCTMQTTPRQCSRMRRSLCRRCLRLAAFRVHGLAVVVRLLRMKGTGGDVLAYCMQIKLSLAYCIFTSHDTFKKRK